jgi:4-amino-4-deoxy-L-arabinose transferase-like glycosyltransferase
MTLARSRDSLVRGIDDRLVGGLCVGVILAVTVASRVHLLGAGERNFDEGVYWLSLRAMQAGHPLYSAVYSSQPPAFLLLTEPVWALLGGSIEAARTVMLAWALIGVASGTVIGWRLAGPVAGISIAALLAIDPMMVQQSVVLQADGPATSLGLLAVALAVCAVTAPGGRGRAATAVLAGVALAVGLLTKLLDAAVVPVLVLVLAGAPRPRRALGLALAGFAVVAAAFLLPYIPAWPALWSQVVGLHLSTGSTASQGISLGDLASWGRHELPEVGLAVLGVLLAWRTHLRLVATGALWVVCGLLTVAATHPVAQHYTIAMSPGLGLLGGAALARLAAWYTSVVTGRWALAAPAVVLAAVAAVLLVRSVEDVQGLPPDPAQVASIEQLVPPGSQLLSDAQYNQASADRQAPPALVDTSMERLHDGDLTPAWLESQVSGDRGLCGVLLATGRLSSVTGFEEWVAANFPDRSELGGGAVMYRRASCG